jgi:hypothetical protein
MVRYVTKAELFYSAVHGTAMRYAAERRNLDESIAELRQLADGHDDVLAEAAESRLVRGSPGHPHMSATNWLPREC